MFRQKKAIYGKKPLKMSEFLYAAMAKIHLYPTTRVR